MSVGRPDPTRQPGSMVQALYRRELLPWALSGFSLGMVEGATAAVLVKKGFADLAPREVLNFAVAFVSGAPALSNMTSFVWANLAHGRERIRLVAILSSIPTLMPSEMALEP